MEFVLWIYLLIVYIKLFLLMTDDAPAKCKDKIAISTDGTPCVIFLARGGHTVQHVPAPFSTIIDVVNKNRDANKSLILLVTEMLYLGLLILVVGVSCDWHLEVANDVHCIMIFVSDHCMQPLDPGSPLGRQRTWS